MNTRTVQSIYRYPVKGLSPQALDEVRLEAAKPFPFDRVFALRRPSGKDNGENAGWAKKGHFLMLMLEHELATVHTTLDPVTFRFTVSERRVTNDQSPPEFTPVLDVNLDTEAGVRAAENYVQHLLPKLAAAPRLVHSLDGHFMDKPDNVLSCINLATVRSLEREWGVPIDPLRFRANFYVEGLRAWEEFDWIGHEITLGNVVCHVDRRNGRCGATNVNPATGERDMDIPGSLRKTMGHKDLGVYLVVRTPGRVCVGDVVTTPELEATATDTPTNSTHLLPSGSFICNGCYFVYDENKGAPGVPGGTPFANIDVDWLCPDCGTVKANFRPYEHR